MSDKLRILFLGAAGSGKGTQSAKLAEKFNLSHISTGDLIRGEIKSGSQLGNKVKAIVEAGNLVSDDIVNEIVKGKVSSLNRFILDGYPRTLEQAKFFSEFSCFEFIFDLEVPRESLIARLTGRRMCTKTNKPDCGGMFHVSFNKPKEEGKCDHCGSDLYQRKDDSLETIEKRLNGYEDETGKPLNDFYASKITKIDGTQNPDQVLSALEEQLKTALV